MGSKLLQNLFKSRLIKVLVVVFSLVVAVGVVKSVFTLTAKRNIVQEQKTVLSELEAKNTDLAARLKEATTASFVERQARNKLGFVKEGETVIIMDRTQNTEFNDQRKSKELQLWKQWWGLFF